jgi:hypothetical protein
LQEPDIIATKGDFSTYLSDKDYIYKAGSEHGSLYHRVDQGIILATSKPAVKIVSYLRYLSRPVVLLGVGKSVLIVKSVRNQAAAGWPNCEQSYYLKQIVTICSKSLDADSCATPSWLELQHKSSIVVGNVKSQSYMQHAVNKELTFDIIRQQKIDSAVLVLDAKSCYDCISPPIASLVLPRQGGTI